TPANVQGKINEMCGLAPTDDILLFEEIKYAESVMCDAMDLKVTFKLEQMEDGDIVCVQHSNPLAQEGAAAAAVAAAGAAVRRGGSGGGSAVRYPDVPSFLKYARNRQLAHLQQLHQTKVPSVRNCATGGGAMGSTGRCNQVVEGGVIGGELSGR
ncbi:unnamed protein product, partial [Closterium sp. NIES-53]